MSGSMVNVPQAPRELLALQNRLTPLLSSLQSLYEQVERNPQSLNLAHIQQHLQILSTLLSSLAASIPRPEQLGQSFYVFSSHPNEKFPAVEHEVFLNRLMRKKPLDNVTEWIDEGMKASEGIKNLEPAEGAGWATDAWLEIIQKRDAGEYEDDDEDDIPIRKAEHTLTPAEAKEALERRWRFESTGVMGVSGHGRNSITQMHGNVAMVGRPGGM
ncbi:hypothetical protein BJ508DRAFT_361996 [Ascobolus immersus RN42]|uniref:Mediator complex subunit 8 n=1 Tax=Ascobolus immersus RN42 TaxID=1160509 RepID=A0A3N4I511_ASCIM|nr:hypothetical protein BJ508DRAFT_361996 [Ascobolus immersus RN42]